MILVLNFFFLESLKNFRIKYPSLPFFDVRYVARSMSGIWPVETGHVPDIDPSCPEYGQFILAMYRTSNFYVRNMDNLDWPCSGHRFCNEISVRNKASEVRNMASDVWNMASDVRNMASDVRNMAKNPGHIPDITF